MPIKPVGWICGQVLKNFSGRIEGFQKAIMDLIDEFKDEFPAILRLSKSNQTKETTQKSSQVNMALALAKINRGTLIQGLNRISRSSKSVARLLQPQLKHRLLELRGISHRLLREVNAPTQPLYNNVQVGRGSLFEIISFPAKAALTSIIYASYATLVYLAVCVNAVLEKAKNIFKEEESIRRNQENELCRKAFSEPVLPEPVFPAAEIKAKPYRSLPEKPDKVSNQPTLPDKGSNKIQVLHSVFDRSAEMNE
ncbi:spermatogenesis-associated protein 9 [Perognathus longimembris pacificus]|uniref:spermatogenesis-associated protein 9 n=1 Tax=Perognathus longimembris pacificus TaxID=214514 RepID=UPI002018B120|nr:spermatogenesis-associated protein 9 [Perognathus longimembris pacificus]